MTDAAEFLTTLWGQRPPGLIELWTKQGKKSHYLRNPVGAGVIAAPGRADVYTGVALAHQDPGRSRRARADHRIALAGLWLDLDVNGGPDSKTGVAPSKSEARELAEALLEPTLVVDSGYGLHAWWLFQTPWAFQATADQQAAALAAAQWYALHRAAAQARGWTIDHTHDLARLLRIPGTVNGKDPDRPRTVTLLVSDGPRYPREQLLAGAAEAGTVALTAAARSGPVSFVLRASNAELERQITDKLDVAEVNSPEFHAAVLRHEGDTRDWTDDSLSEWDMSIATQAAQAGWGDQDIADLLVFHRERWSPGDPKSGRTDYLRRTIGRARSRARRDEAAGRMRDRAGMAA